MLSRSDNFTYTAGQWVGVNFLNLPGELQGHLGRIGSPHPYSICTPPSDGSNFEIVIKSMGKGTWSQKVLLVRRPLPLPLCEGVKSCEVHCAAGFACASDSYGS